MPREDDDPGPDSCLRCIRDTLRGSGECARSHLQRTASSLLPLTSSSSSSSDGCSDKPTSGDGGVERARWNVWRLAHLRAWADAKVEQRRARTHPRMFVGKGVGVRKYA